MKQKEQQLEQQLKLEQLILFDKYKLKQKHCQAVNCLYQKTLKYKTCYLRQNILLCDERRIKLIDN
jgi:hypothetical protein